MAPYWAIHLVGAFALIAVSLATNITSLPEDYQSLLQVAADVHVMPALDMAIIPNPDLATSGFDQSWSCKEGDRFLAFHAGRDCSDFKEEELDLPMSTWPYMTRWCKLANRDTTMASDQCMAQHCIARQSPSLAAKVWWDTKTSQSTSWQNFEFPYCERSGYCSGHRLSHNSTLEDMESFCDTKFKDDWKKLSPRDTLNWIQNGVGDIEMLTCSWGTLHCDVTRCHQYLCGPKAETVALTRRQEAAEQTAHQQKAAELAAVLIALTKASDLQQATST